MVDLVGSNPSLRTNGTIVSLLLVSLFFDSSFNILNHTQLIRALPLHCKIRKTNFRVGWERSRNLCPRPCTNDDSGFSRAPPCGVWLRPSQAYRPRPISICQLGPNITINIIIKNIILTTSDPLPLPPSAGSFMCCAWWCLRRPSTAFAMPSATSVRRCALQ